MESPRYLCTWSCGNGSVWFVYERLFSTFIFHKKVLLWIFFLYLKYSWQRLKNALPKKLCKQQQVYEEGVKLCLNNVWYIKYLLLNKFVSEKTVILWKQSKRKSWSSIKQWQLCNLPFLKCVPGLHFLLHTLLWYFF